MKKLFIAVTLTLLALACSSEPDESLPAACDGGSCDAGCEADTCEDCDGGTCKECDGADCTECHAADDCSAGQSCSDGRCIDDTPCELGCAQGQHCEPDSQQCVYCLGHGDCLTSQYCDAIDGFDCKVDVCPSGESRCGAQGIEVCSASGASWLDAVPCPPETTCHDADGQAWCEPARCDTGQQMCAGTRLVECGESGTDWNVVRDCASSGSYCVESMGGADCMAPTCEPGTRACNDDDDVVECDSLGFAFSLIQDCSADNPCDTATLRCAEQVCVPNELSCVGSAVALCDTKGIGYASITPCAGDELCDGGSCAKVVCVPDAYTCQGNKIFQCNASGTALTESADCADKYCVPGEATCRDQLCTPGETTCYGKFAASCNSDGSAYVSTTDCSTTQEICVAGACEPRVCEPNAYSCSAEGNVQRCNVSGSGFSYGQTCFKSHCVPGYFTCIPDICEASQPTCFGQVASVCNGTGDGYEPGAVDCRAQDQACVDGACVPWVCEPNKYVCVGGEPYACNYYGTQLSKQTACSGSQFCDPEYGWCRPDKCQANSLGCVGTQLATCAADGSGYVAGSTDCADTGEACSGGQCVSIICSEPLQCKDGSVYECVDSGGALKLKTSCGYESHCIDSDFSCAPNVCGAGQPTCDGNRATTCSTDGTAFQAGGTVCSQACAAGTCTSSLFSETFEDGDADGWSTTGSPGVSVSAAAAANGTSFGLTVTGSASQATLTREFPESQPSRISWWQYVDTTSQSELQFDSTTYVEQPIALRFEGNRVRLDYIVLATLAPDAWHSFEFRNLNWTTNLCDLYVDGALVYSGAWFTLSHVGRARLIAAPQSTLQIDEIIFD